MYDISDDRVRERVADILKIHGLSRIQRSVFVGPGSRAIARDIARAVSRVIDPSTDVVHIVVVQDFEWSMRFVIGSGGWDGESRSSVLII